MYQTSVVALFSEDIREELGSVVTLVGVMPDNINVAAAENGGEIPSAAGPARARNLSKLCIYVRINFDPDSIYSSGTLRMIFPDGASHELGGIDSETLASARKNAKQKKNPLAGVITRMVLNGFQLPSPGVLKVEVQLDDQVFLAGAINFMSGAESVAPPSN